ncbi:MAG: 5'-3' exonuclease H3TH domain-containing protein [Gammaproteobacteria bacterium]|nr:5'-3' exonuclease H3TH domain-containing protein [Gammaproteobacteria bacterium]MDP2349246.1 5'-3' exonuclease H3TH domain-containing protein [Gammaproteobacteria bacterium]
MSQPVYLVDASIYIFQAYFSPNLQIWSDDDRDLSAFYGFAQFLLRFLRHTRPVHIAAAFDESLFCGFRHTLYPAYKSNRELPDENLARQLSACAELARLLGIASFGSRVYEADDIIGTLAARVRQESVPEICIVSRDKDLAQLLRGDRDHLWDFSGNSRRFRKEIIQQYGIRPEQFPCYLGLIGDAVDSIPGVPGVGPVAATCLLRHFESLPLLYEHLDEVPTLSYRGAAKAPDLLRRYESQARMSRTLATIVEDVVDPVERFSVADCRSILRGEVQSDGIRDLLVREGLETSLRDRFLSLLDGLQPAAKNASESQ